MSVVVAGGGLAGAAAACLLARAGAKVMLVEREAGPVDKICGEFLSAETQHFLRRIGLDPADLGGHPITALRLVRGASVVESGLPFAGLGLSRRVLDEALLAQCGRLGVDVRRGHGLSVAPAGGPMVRVGGVELRADTLFLATGKHDMRGLRRAGAPSDLVGFKLHLRLSRGQTAALAKHVEIVLLRGGYAGLQLVEHGTANLCLLVSRARLQQAGGTWETLLAELQREPHLCRRLEGAEALGRPLSIARVPYGFVHAAAPDETVFRLGDQMGVIPSFTGDGMAIALHSAATAAACHLSGGTPAQYHRRMRADIARQIGRAGALARLGGSAPGQALLMHMAALWPGGLRLAARLTRVPARAVARVAP